MFNRVARQVRGKWHATTGIAGGLRWRCHRRVVIGRLRRLEIFEHQPQLRDIHLLGAATELDAQQPSDAMFELLDLQRLGIDRRLRHLQLSTFPLQDIGHLAQHFLQENRVCWKAIKGEPHAADNR